MTAVYVGLFIMFDSTDWMYIPFLIFIFNFYSIYWLRITDTSILCLTTDMWPNFDICLNIPTNRKLFWVFFNCLNHAFFFITERCFVGRAVWDDRCLMSGRSPGPGRSLSGAAGVPCMCLLQRCLAVQLQRVSLVDPRRAPPSSEPPQQQYWMYDSGYLIFQVRRL